VDTGEAAGASSNYSNVENLLKPLGVFVNAQRFVS
jgi:hypothetical protein